jgi:hypothetical protein
MHSYFNLTKVEINLKVVDLSPHITSIITQHANNVAEA